MPNAPALIDVSAVDRSKLPIPREGEGRERFHALYQFRSYKRKQHLMVVAPAPGGDEPVMPSLTPLFQGANWPERERGQSGLTARDDVAGKADVGLVFAVVGVEGRCRVLPVFWAKNEAATDAPIRENQISHTSRNRIF